MTLSIRDESAEDFIAKAIFGARYVREQVISPLSALSPGHLPPPREGCPGRGRATAHGCTAGKGNVTRCALSSSAARPRPHLEILGPQQLGAYDLRSMRSSMPSRATSWTPPHENPLPRSTRTCQKHRARRARGPVERGPLAVARSITVDSGGRSWTRPATWSWASPRAACPFPSTAMHEAL